MAEMKLKVDTGAVTYRIYDADGEEIGKVKFTPTDTGIMERQKQVVDYLNSVQFREELDAAEQIVELDRNIREQFDYLFGRPVSKDLFALAQPLTPLENGDFFFDSILDAVGDVISKAYKERLDRKMQKVAEATKDYEAESAASDTQ